MKRTMAWRGFLASALLFTGGCGAAQSGPSFPGGETLSSCTDGADCQSGICRDNTCVDAVDCSTGNDCDTTEYCHYPSEPEPWVAGTHGVCDERCTSNSSCGVTGQECHSSRCYTNIKCDPAKRSADCPPGEACNSTSRTCKWAPDRCSFSDECPSGWICNTDKRCIDPRAVGSCVSNNDCESRSGCESGACECVDRNCRIRQTCNPAQDVVAQCGRGNYCQGGVCRPATACPTGQAICTNYGLVCTSGYCINPTPCSSGTCPVGFECRQTSNPPACFPIGSAVCTRNEQCAADQYCDVLAGSCKIGCRSNTDCAGKCGTNATCYCQSNHTCDPRVPTQTGAPCVDDANCPGGTRCFYDVPECALSNSGRECPKSCREVCDMILNLITNTCPDGQKCGGEGLGEAILSAIMQLLSADGISSASICYPVR